MNAAPKGKTGRLPKAVQINRRLENGERARTLVAWLNALPEVQAVLVAEFEDPACLFAACGGRAPGRSPRGAFANGVGAPGG